MSDYISILEKDLLDLIDNLIKSNIVNQDFKKDNLTIDYLSKSKQGEVSTNLFILLNSQLKNKNYDLRKKIYNNIIDFEYVKNVEITKVGFINFFFEKDFLIKKLYLILSQPNNYGNNASGNNDNINIEFVSANPTGPLHIAHIRGAVLGDVLASILQATGHKVTREYYVNDAGSQINILGNSLYKRYQQIFGDKIEISSEEYPGEYLIPIAKLIADSDKDKWLKIKEVERKKYFERFAIKELVKSIKLDLKSINISFDQFIYESTIVENKVIDKVFSILKDKDLLYEGFLEKPKGDDSTDWKPRKQLLFRSSNFTDDSDRPFKKVSGEWTYFANDAAYHFDKYLRNYTHLINIWGADHIGYINRMKSLTEVITDNPNYLEVYVCQIVRLIKDNNFLKMSKREGNFITLNEIVKKVGKDPLRYFMISSKNETPMDFDMDKVIEKNKDNPVFYCQYAYARASSVINKSKTFKEFKNFKNKFNEFDYSLLSKYEWEIILKLLSWPYLLNQTSLFKQPHRITNYLEDLSSSFHSFWNKGKEEQSLRMLDLENTKKTLTKLLWIESFRIVVKRAFTIIGIEAHENM
jgi:arginyl-tRNA synthetase